MNRLYNMCLYLLHLNHFINKYKYYVLVLFCCVKWTYLFWYDGTMCVNVLTLKCNVLCRCNTFFYLFWLLWARSIAVLVAIQLGKQKWHMLLPIRDAARQCAPCPGFATGHITMTTTRATQKIGKNCNIQRVFSTNNNHFISKHMVSF